MENSTPYDWLKDKKIDKNETFSSLPKNSDSVKGIVVMLGTNYVYGTNDMIELIEKLHNKYEDKTIYVNKLLPLQDSRTDEDKNQRIYYNDKIQEVCKDLEYTKYIDATADVEIEQEGETAGEPTNDGYKKLGENMKNAIIDAGGGNQATTYTSKYDGFQGNIKIRRVTPNKALGADTDTSGGIVAMTGSSSNSSSSSSGAGTAIEAEIKNYIESNEIASGEWSVYAKNLSTNSVEININNKKMQSASVIKLFIMATAYNEIKNGSLNENQVTNDIRIMINNSDNDATNRLINKLGFDKINKYIKDNGYNDTEINRKMLDQTATEDNYTSVKDVTKILNQIYKEKCVSAEYSKKMLGFLKEQKRTNKIPAGVPSGVQTANKTGELSTVENDAAIVYKEGIPYILVVMSSGLSDTGKARENIKQISSKVYEKIGADGSNKSEDDQEENNNSSNKKHKVVVDAGHGRQQIGGRKVAGSYGNLATSEEDVGTKDYYTTGTSGKAADGSTWQEWETVQKVVDKVKKIMAEKYPDIEVVQTGKDEPNFRRIKLAKEANAEAYVGVHLNSSDNPSTSGSEVYIRPGEGNEQSKEFGQSVVDAVHNKLQLKNNGVNANLESNTRGLKTYEECGIPNIYIEGAYMSSSKDMGVVGSDEGLDKYAEGIADGIANYFGMKKSTIETTTSEDKTSSAVNSKVYDLRYVSEDEFEGYVKQNSEEAIKTFTLDKEGKLITAKWSYSSDSGLKISKNSPINFKTVMSKYITTYEYMLDYWIDIKEEDFMHEFVDMILDSEFVIAIQDNVTTTKTETKTIVSPGGTTSNVIYSESVKDTIELTYADTWFVTFSKDYNYSNLVVQSDSVAGSTLTGTRGGSLGMFTITGYCPCTSCSGPWGYQTSTGATCTVNRTIATDQSVIPAGTKVMINNQIYVAEDVGGGVNGKHIDIFVATHPETFSDYCNGQKEVFLVENVQEGKAEYKADKTSKGFIQNAIANVPGKVTDKTSHSELTTTSTGTSTVNGETVEITITTTNITDIHTVSNEYDTGESNVASKEDEFVELFEKYPDAKRRVKPRWLVRLIEKNATQMLDLTKFLLNELLGEVIFPDIDRDAIFEKYKHNEFQIMSSGSVDISLTTSVMDKETFVKALQAYYDKTGNLAFKQNFLSRAEEIYDLGEKYNVNPELVVTMALKESGFKSSGGNQNYWGLGTPNGAALKFIGTFEEGVQQLANSFASYMEGSGTWQEKLIIERYNERKDANCNSNGYGQPGTLKGMLSVYSDLCGEDTKHREGNWGSGGNIYLREIYGVEFQAKCGSVHKIGVDDYTVQEKADYTAWLYENQLKYWNDIFGEFATLGGGDIRAVCQEITDLYISRNGHYGAQTYNNIEQVYNSDTNLVCATYVTLVLWKSGLMTTEQINAYNYHYTVDYPNMLMAAGFRQVDKSDLQPGDVLNKPGGNPYGHVVIYVGDGLIYDQKSAVISSRGVPPTGGPASGSNYINDPGFIAWRAPSR